MGRSFVLPLPANAPVLVRLIATSTLDERSYGVPACTFHMSSRKLENYLRMHRKKSGLTQSEVAFLLGCQSGAKVCRYERRNRRPGLETVFACEFIFHTPASELFAGMRDRARRSVQRRARRLLLRHTKSVGRQTAEGVSPLLLSIAKSHPGELRYEPVSRS